MRAGPVARDFLHSAAIPNHNVVGEDERWFVGIGLFLRPLPALLLSASGTSRAPALATSSAERTTKWSTLLAAERASLLLALLHHAVARHRVQPAQLHDSIMPVRKDVVGPGVVSPAIVENHRLRRPIDDVVGDQHVTRNVVEINSNTVVAVRLLEVVGDIMHPVIDDAIARGFVGRDINTGKVADDALSLLVNVIVGNRVVAWERASTRSGHADADPSAVEIVDLVVSHRVARRVSDPHAHADSRRKNASPCSHKIVLNHVIVGDVVFAVVLLMVAANSNSAGAQIIEHIILRQVVVRWPIVPGNEFQAPPTRVGNGAGIKSDVIRIAEAQSRRDIGFTLQGLMPLRRHDPIVMRKSDPLESDVTEILGDDQLRQLRNDNDSVLRALTLSRNVG